MDNTKVFKVIIIGGGASGLISAIELSKKFKGENVALVERLDRVGKKLLSTGNGQCNFSNSDGSLCHFHSQNNNFYKTALTTFSNDFIVKYFEDLGILSTCEDGKFYPLSKQASSVLDALRFKIQSLNTKVFLNSKVVLIKKDKFFKVELENGEILQGEKVVLCVGGKSASHLGSDGSSYGLYQNFGHTLTDLTPQLVQLKVETSKIKGLKGLKQKALVKVQENGKIINEFLGDVMFTDYGLSGNAIFSASSYVSYNNSSLLLDFCPQISTSKLVEILKNKQKNCPYLTNEYLLSGIVNNKIASAILRNLNLCNLQDKIEFTNVEKVAKYYGLFGV